MPFQSFVQLGAISIPWNYDSAGRSTLSQLMLSHSVNDTYSSPVAAQRPARPAKRERRE